MNFIYVLVLQACLVGKPCLPSAQFDRYDNHYDCAMAGYTQSRLLHKLIAKDQDKNMPLAVKFWCAKYPISDI